VRTLGLAAAALKWPNDVVVSGAKLAGVLAETRDLDPRRPAYVAGIGVNVLQRSFPPELLAERAVTSLALSGVLATVDDVLRELVAAVPRRTRAIDADPAANERDFLSAAGLDAGPARVVHAGGTTTGQIATFSASEGLTLRAADGSILRLPLEHVRALEPANFRIDGCA
jgi:BirA family biotin operon repressor/biotin-[acetyl-CoA-carboxylase] ligase